MSVIEIDCPACRKRLRLDQQLQGKTIRCPACKAAIALRPATSENDPPKPHNPAPRLRTTSQDASQPAVRTRSAGTPSSRAGTPVRPGRGRSAASSGGIAAAGRYRRDDVSNNSDENDEDLEEYAEDYDDPYSVNSIAARRRPVPKYVPLRTRLKALLPLLMGLAGICIVGVVAFVAFNFMPALRIPGLSGNVIDLRYCPQNMVGVIHMDVADILASPVMKGLIDQKPEFRQAFGGPADLIGLKAEDIHSLTLAVCHDGGSGDSPQMAGMMFPTSGSGNGMITIIRLKTTRSPESLSLRKFESYKGTDLYEAAGQTLWMPDDRTMVIGRREEIVAAVDQGQKELRFSQFDFAGAGYDLIIAGNTDPSRTTTTVPGNPGGGSVSANSESPVLPTSRLNPLFGLPDSMAHKTRATSISASFTGRIDVLMQIVMEDSQTAETMITRIQQAITRFQTGISSGNTGPIPYDIANRLSTILERLKLSRSGSSVNLTLVIERNDIERVASITYGNR